MVIAVPATNIVQCDHEQVPPVKFFQHMLAVRIDERPFAATQDRRTTNDERWIAVSLFVGRWSLVVGQAKHRIAERTAEPTEDGGLQDKGSQMSRQLLQHLLD